ncbi:MAG: N-carbamoylputrescine amidase [Bacteroidetes bacterium]|nr:N-carbamoylputrescine amidase [Bacteroidota bacterium]
MKNEKINVALIQLACSLDVKENEEKTIIQIKNAAKAGAHIICLQELFNAIYFCQYVDVESYKFAQKYPNPSVERLQILAKSLGIVLIVPFFEEAMPGVYFNSAVIYDADGSALGIYRKNHIPEGPQYLEKYYFTPGNLGYPVFDTKYGKIGIGICWDQWFPEVARILSLQGAEILLYPTAIGSEPDRPDFDSSEPWRTIIRSHAIANNVFVGAVNRVGKESEMSFYGKSFVANPYGEIIADAGGQDQIILASCDLTEIRASRELLQFFRDRRVDTYQPLLNKINV